MPDPRLILLLSDTRPSAAVLGAAVDRLRGAGAPVVLATYQPLSYDATTLVDDVRALTPAAQSHGPAFRRALRRAEAPKRFWLHVQYDGWATDRAQAAGLVVAMTPRARLAARRLGKQHPDLDAAMSVEDAVAALDQRKGPNHDHGPGRRDAPGGEAPTRRRRLTGLAGTVAAERLPAALLRAAVVAPRLSEQRRYSTARRAALDLLAAGRPAAADSVVLTAQRRIATLRLRADLLGDVVSWSLAHGQQPELAIKAYAAELAVADEHHACGRHRAAAESFDEAMRTAFHRVLHFDGVTSALAAAPEAFTAPLHESAVARAVRAPQGGDQREGVDRQREGGEPTRLLIATRINDDYLDEIREHFMGDPAFDTRFVDFADAEELAPYAKTSAPIVEETLAHKGNLAAAAETVFRPHLDWADVVFVEWCTALAALITRVAPRHTRIVVRMHSFEAFTHWPQLIDFSRIDDMVFVSDHLRDLAVAAIPALQEPHAPRLHVIANAMELRRFDRPKDDAARFTLGLVGASKMVKDPRWAIEVLRHLREHDERYRLVLIRGSFQADASAATQEYAEGLRRDLAELEPVGAVRIVGHTDDVPAALGEVGVVLSTSARESFHMGLVEGAASGAVPVVRDWPFFPGAAARLFPADWVVDSPRAAADRILEATSTDEQWRRVGRAAADYVIDRWDWDVVRTDLDDLLRRRTHG